MSYEPSRYIEVLRGVVAGVGPATLAALGVPVGGDVQIGATTTLTITNSFPVTSTAYVWTMGPDWAIQFTGGLGAGGTPTNVFERSVNAGAFAIPAAYRGWDVSNTILKATGGPNVTDIGNFAGAAFMEVFTLAAGASMTYAVRRRIQLNNVAGGATNAQFTVDGAPCDILALQVG